jgi:hypothetical protein
MRAAFIAVDPADFAFRGNARRSSGRWSPDFDRSGLRSADDLDDRVIDGDGFV